MFNINHQTRIHALTPYHYNRYIAVYNLFFEGVCYFTPSIQKSGLLFIKDLLFLTTIPMTFLRPLLYFNPPSSRTTADGKTENKFLRVYSNFSSQP